MRRIVRPPLLLLFIPLLACVAGCADNAASVPAAPTAQVSAMKAAGTPSKPDVPFGGAATGGVTVVVPSQECQTSAPPPLYGFGTITATGNALHMGNINIRTEQCLNLNTGVINGRLIVLTAANGDELHGTFTGQSESSGVVGTVFHTTFTMVFNGGTGRFENATGTAEVSGVLTHAESFPWPGRWEWTGTVRY